MSDEEPFDIKIVLNSAATMTPVNESKSKIMHSVNNIRSRSKFNSGNNKTNSNTHNHTNNNRNSNNNNNSNSVLLSPNKQHSRKKHHRKLVSNNNSAPGNKANQVSGFQT